MDREEAKGLFEYYDGSIPNEDVIDKIFNELESRICENCEYWAKDIRMCDNKDSFAYDSKATVVKGDGCNKFERKSSE